MVEQDLRDGHHRNLTGDVRHFTDAYFHLPDELREEIAGAGLSVSRLIGIEGPFWNVVTLPGWATQEARKIILDLLKQIEEEPSLLGASAHISGSGAKSTSAIELESPFAGLTAWSAAAERPLFRS